MRHGIPYKTKEMPLCGTAYLTKQRRTQPSPICLLYKYRGSCVLLYTNARVITHYISMARAPIYNGIRGIGQAFDKTIRLGNGCVFSVATHIAPFRGWQSIFDGIQIPTHHASSIPYRRWFGLMT